MRKNAYNAIETVTARAGFIILNLFFFFPPRAMEQLKTPKEELDPARERSQQQMLLFVKILFTFK